MSALHKKVMIIQIERARTATRTSLRYPIIDTDVRRL